MSFASELFAIALFALVYGLSESKSVSFRQANFRISTPGNETFLVQDGKLDYGKWVQPRACQEVSAEEINSIKVTNSNVGIFGACEKPFLPQGTKGYFFIDTSEGKKLAKINFDVPFMYRKSAVNLTDLSAGFEHKCKEGKKKVAENEVFLEVICE